MKAIHFGAGNIGRGFIGEVYFDNNIDVIFVDVQEEIIKTINNKREIPIYFAGENLKNKYITNIHAINSLTDMDAVINEFIDADIVSASVGANNLKHIAKTIANGLQHRMNRNIIKPIDVIACENLIHGSQKLKVMVLEHCDDKTKAYLDKYVGFPNAAIDRIVPDFKSDNPLAVKVEPFREWIIEKKDLKSKLKLKTVLYVDSLKPYIERKLFTVNTGHGALAYLGLHYGLEDSISATQDKRIMKSLKAVLDETGQYLIHNYSFDELEHQKYINKTIERFKNEKIKDDLKRIARNQITKLGYDERFIKPMRKLEEIGLENKILIDTVALIFTVVNEDDKESLRLKEMLENDSVQHVVGEVTGLKALLAEKIISEIKKVMSKNCCNQH